MTTNSASIHVDPDRVTHALEHEAVEQLNYAEGEVVLDLSSVVRIDPSAATAMEKLADLASRTSVKVVLRGVNIDIYRVLKLLKLTDEFSFRS